MNTLMAIKQQTVAAGSYADDQLNFFTPGAYTDADPPMLIVSYPHAPPTQRTPVFFADYDTKILLWQEEWSASEPSAASTEPTRGERLRELAAWSAGGMGLDLEQLADAEQRIWGTPQ